MIDTGTNNVSTEGLDFEALAENPNENTPKVWQYLSVSNGLQRSSFLKSVVKEDKTVDTAEEALQKYSAEGGSHLM